MRSFAKHWGKAAALGAFLALTACRSGDRLVLPTPDPQHYVGMRLTCLNATSPDHVVTAGYLTDIGGNVETILLRSESGGDKWQRVGSETFNFEHLVPQAVLFADTLRGWMAGIRVIDGQTLPLVLRTEDGGGHWRESLIPHDRSTTVTELTDLRFESDDIGFVTVHFVPEGSTESRVNVYTTADGGRHWVIKDFTDPSPLGPTDTAEIFVSENEGFRLALPLENGTQVLYFSGTKGQTWVPRSQFHLSQLLSYY